MNTTVFHAMLILALSGFGITIMSIIGLIPFIAVWPGLAMMVFGASLPDMAKSCTVVLGKKK